MRTKLASYRNRRACEEEKDLYQDQSLPTPIGYRREYMYVSYKKRNLLIEQY